MSTDTPRDRYAQCDDTCTVDCGACKGAGRPTAPTPRDDLDAAAAELLALQHTDHPLPGWDVTCSVCRLTPAEAFRLGYRAAVAAYRAAQDGGAEEAVRRVEAVAARLDRGGYRVFAADIRAALAPQAGDGAR